MYIPTHGVEGRMIALIILTSLVNFILYFLLIQQSNERRHWPLPTENSSTVISASIIPSHKTTVRATLVHWYGPLNYMAMKAWIKYHNERWGVTHVDIFLPARRLDEARHTFGETYSGAIVSIYNNLISEELGQTDLPYRDSIHANLLFGQALKQSRAENNDFLMNFDADEFLVSDDFATIAEMFAHANNRKAVSIPVFGKNYHICSSNNLTFGSTTFGNVGPVGSKFVNDSRLEYYTEPPRACNGNSKYIVIPKFFRELKSPHDPYGCISQEDTNRPPASDTTYYMTGRRTESEHVRVVHLRTELGIFADLTMSACVGIFADCKYLNGDNSCTDNVAEAYWIHEVNEMNTILHDFPLFTDASVFSAHAVCYAQRYPSLLKQFCPGGDIKLCSFGALGLHYKDHGKLQNLTWGCAPQFPL